MAVDAEAQIFKVRQDAQDKANDDYDKIAARDQEIEGLKEQLRDINKEIGNIRKENSTFRTDFSLFKADLTKKDEAIKKAEDRAKKAEGLVQYNHEQTQNLQNEIDKKSQEVLAARKAVKGMKDRCADDEGLKNSLHQEVDQLKAQVQELQNAQDQNCHAADTLNQMGTDLENIFTDLAPGVAVDQYLDHIRALQNRPLTREASHSSLASEIPPSGRRGDQSKGRSVSLGDQINDSDLSDDEKEEGDGDDDPTLSNIKVEENVQFDFAPIVSIDTAPGAPPAPKSTISENASTQTELQAPVQVTPAASTQEALTMAELWNLLPWWAKILLLMAIMAYIYTFAGLVGERSMWLAANDTTRQRVVDLTMGSESGWLTPLLLSFEDWIGAERGLLG